MDKRQQLEEAVRAAQKDFDDFVAGTYEEARAKYRRCTERLDRARQALRLHDRRREQQAVLAALSEREGDDLLAKIATGHGKMWEFDYFSKTGQPLRRLDRLSLELELSGRSDLSYSQLIQTASDLLGFDVIPAGSQGDLARFTCSDFGQIKQSIERGAVSPKSILVIYEKTNRCYRRRLDEIMVYPRKDKS